MTGSCAARLQVCGNPGRQLIRWAPAPGLGVTEPEGGAGWLTQKRKVARGWDSNSRGKTGLPTMWGCLPRWGHPHPTVCVHSRLHSPAVRPSGGGRLHPGLPLPAVRPAGLRHRPLQLRREAGLRVISPTAPPRRESTQWWAAGSLPRSSPGRAHPSASR